MENNLSELYNPNGIKGIWTAKMGFIVESENQSFQEFPKKVELWQMLEDGRLLKIGGWLKTSIPFACYKRTDNANQLEEWKPYIYPKK